MPHFLNYKKYFLVFLILRSPIIYVPLMCYFSLKTIILYIISGMGSADFGLLIVVGDISRKSVGYREKAILVLQK